jgi:hypothetical protein
MSRPQDTTTSHVAREFIINRQGKDHVLYDGLLDLAHRSFTLEYIRTQLLQAPCDANLWTAICFAEVKLSTGVFTGIGDANPRNVGKNIADHAIRMAETRAKARALRDGMNIKGAALEELGPEPTEEAPHQPPAVTPTHRTLLASLARAWKTRTGEDLGEADPDEPVSYYEGGIARLMGLLAQDMPLVAGATPASEVSLERLARAQDHFARKLGVRLALPADLSEDAATFLLDLLNDNRGGVRRAS